MDEIDASFDQTISVEQSPVLQMVLKKHEEENQKIAELRQQAKSDLDNWYSERQRRVDQKLEKMLTNDQEFLSKANETIGKHSCDWSKVLSLIDLTDMKPMTRTKRDLTRMRECLFNAKRFQEKTMIKNGI